MTMTFRRKSFWIASILSAAQILSSNLLAADGVLNPSDKGFIEKFNKVKCDKERAEAVDLKERALHSLRAFEINSVLTEVLSTSPGKEKVNALITLWQAADSELKACEADDAKWFNKKLDQERCRQNITLANESLKARAQEIENLAKSALKARKLDDFEFAYRDGTKGPFEAVPSFKAEVSPDHRVPEFFVNFSAIFNRGRTSEVRASWFVLKRQLSISPDNSVESLVRDLHAKAVNSNDSDFSNCPLLRGVGRTCGRVWTPFAKSPGYFSSPEMAKLCAAVDTPFIPMPSQVYDSKDARIRHDLNKKIDDSVKAVEKTLEAGTRSGKAQ